MIPSSETAADREKATEDMDEKKPRRLWEVDAARGIAILMMVLYHFVYDLDAFGGYRIESTSGFWATFADATAASFVFLVGVSLTLSFSKAEEVRPGRPGLFEKYLRRGGRILLYGMAITAVTWLLGIGIIWFGILHLIGVSIILAYPFLRLPFWAAALGVFFIALGLYMSAQNVSSEISWLLPLGVVPENLPMPDYRPLLPWFGVVLLGIFAGNLVYGRERTSRLRKPEKAERGSQPVLAGPLAFLGRHSLAIYLVHQPVLVTILLILGIIKLGSF